MRRGRAPQDLHGVGEGGPVSAESEVLVTRGVDRTLGDARKRLLDTLGRSEEDGGAVLPDAQTLDSVAKR